mmetsp:Transcript_2413/g.4918  ORF Transcript_2413/g.4918 Transcript_2413/m.4918 type:complete len:231 (+) Transcript_2413:516-1208(+)
MTVFQYHTALFKCCATLRCTAFHERSQKLALAPSVECWRVSRRPRTNTSLLFQVRAMREGEQVSRQAHTENTTQRTTPQHKATPLHAHALTPGPLFAVTLVMLLCCRGRIWCWQCCLWSTSFGRARSAALAGDSYSETRWSTARRLCTGCSRATGESKDREVHLERADGRRLSAQSCSSLRLQPNRQSSPLRLQQLQRPLFRNAEHYLAFFEWACRPLAAKPALRLGCPV